MRLLLDTHAFLWFILSDKRLSAKARAAIMDPANDVLVSPATFWEIAIKISLGKYRLPGPFEPFIQSQMAQNQFTILPITIAHVAVVSTLPHHHRDPFDRLLVAQALAEKIPLLSEDAVLDAYGVQRIG